MSGRQWKDFVPGNLLPISMLMSRMTRGGLSVLGSRVEIILKVLGNYSSATFLGASAVSLSVCSSFVPCVDHQALRAPVVGVLSRELYGVARGAEAFKTGPVDQERASLCPSISS